MHEGAVAVTSFYPIPNNHVFYNFLSWIIEALLPGQARVVMRLPSLLVATAGTALGYALLTHFHNFRVATLVVALFGLTRLTIIYAASGRGYFLQIVCIQLAFFAIVGAATQARYRRLAWAVFLGTSIVGLYTIPTYAAPLGALFLALGAAGFTLEPPRRSRWWSQVVLAGAIVAGVTGVLYSPVGCVSGWPRLLDNRYLAPHAWATFLGMTRGYLYETAGMLFDHPRPGLLLSVALVALTPWLVVRAPFSARGRWLAGVSWLLLTVPAALMVAQRVFIPARALVYGTYFLFLLGALAADYATTRLREHWAARLPTGLLVVLMLWRVLELASQVPALFSSRAETALVARSYAWLQAQPRGPVLLSAPYHEIMFYHYSLLSKQPLTLHAKQVAGVRYAQVVWMKGQAAPPGWLRTAPYRPAYQDSLVTIYARSTP